MKKNLKRILSLGIAVFLLFGLLPCVFATEGQKDWLAEESASFSIHTEKREKRANE